LKDIYKENTVKANVMHPKTWEQSKKNLKTQADRDAEERMYEINWIVYLAYDFMTFVEYGSALPKDTWHHQALFEKFSQSDATQI